MSDKQPEDNEELEDLDLADEDAQKVKGSITLKKSGSGRD